MILSNSLIATFSLDGVNWKQRMSYFGENGEFKIK